MRHSGRRARVSRMVSAKIPRPAVRQIVAIDRRDHHVGQTERLDGAADPRGFVWLGGRGPAVRHRAIGARARADLTENHERGRAVMPALADVGAVRFLAHGVEAEIAHEAFEARVVRRSRRTHLEPVRFRRPVADRHERDQVAHPF